MPRRRTVPDPAADRALDRDWSVCEADEAVALAVAERAAALRAARDAGATWRQLGAALGVSGERAQQAARQG